MPDLIMAPGIFAATLVIVIWRPGNINEAIPALIGALLALLTGVVTWYDVWFVGTMVWNATFALIAIMIISAILDQIGFFQWAALSLAKKAGGHGHSLFFTIILLGSLITVFFNNDGTVLVLTPIVIGMAQQLSLPLRQALPLVVACGFIADTASIPLVVSNLVNILTADYLQLGFGAYAAMMVVPGLAGILASALVLYLFYRRDIPTQIDTGQLPEPATAVKDWWLCRVALAILGLVIAGYFIGSWFHLPVSLIAGTGSMLLLLISTFRKTINPRLILRQAPWPIVAFAMGMYLVVYGLGHLGLPVLLAELLHQAIGESQIKASLVSGSLFTATAALMNNLPSAMISSLAVAATSFETPLKETVALACIVGNGIGAKLTPVGSLATLMWLHILRQKGIDLSWTYYLKVGLVLTPFVLLATLLSLGWWLQVVL
ncbi:MAG: arsenical efflux pump membrane protein ArsB [Bacillota bacterium]